MRLSRGIPTLDGSACYRGLVSNGRYGRKLTLSSGGVGPDKLFSKLMQFVVTCLKLPDISQSWRARCALAGSSPNSGPLRRSPDCSGLSNGPRSRLADRLDVHSLGRVRCV